MNRYKLYIQMCKNQISLITLGIVILISNAVIIVKIPFAMNDSINSLVNLTKSNFNQFLKYFIVFMGLFLGQLLLDYFSSLVFTTIGNRISTELCSKVYKKIYYHIKTEPSQIEIGDILVGLDSDCFSLGENGIMIVYQFATLIIHIIGVFYFMIITNIYLSLIIIIVFSVLMIIQKMNNKHIEKVVNEKRDISGNYTDKVQALANHYEEYRRNKAFNYLIKRFIENVTLLLHKGYVTTKIISRSNLINGLGSLINSIIVFLLGAYFVLNNQLTISRLITFNTYSGSFGSYLTQIPNLFMQLKIFKVSYIRIKKIMDLDCYQQNEYHLASSIGDVKEIKFDNVTFMYKKDTDKWNFNFQFAKGNIYGIKGKNGSGKTTLLKLLSGEYNINDGLIFVNGKQVSLFDSRLTWDSIVSYLSTDSVLFKDSLRNNIFLDKTPNLEKMNQIFEVVKLKEWVNNLKDVHNTIVDEVNMNISSGQKQKLAIARVLIQDSDILIFDELEKHLDEKTKLNIMDYLNQIKMNKIIIITTHDDVINEKCDCNIVI
ncbi:ABC transporter ATP-binding protein [Clostridiaceae bacterium M8S5]|nr:ABC transporter ATP-binding protein [Clostridiaceae bacterium M8S5]